MVHFADRFPMEDFLLFDAGRYLFGVHPAGRPWYTLQGKDAWERVQSETEKLSTAELHYRELFRSFCHTIAIKERENRELQRNMLPLRFQEYMVEFRVDFAKLGFGFYRGNATNIQIAEKVFRIRRPYCCENDNRVVKMPKMCVFWKKKTALHLGMVGYNSNDFRCEGKVPGVLFYLRSNLLLKGRNKKC